MEEKQENLNEVESAVESDLIVEEKIVNDELKSTEKEIADESEGLHENNFNPIENDAKKNRGSSIESSAKWWFLKIAYILPLCLIAAIAITLYSNMLREERQRLADYKQHLTNIIIVKNMEIKELDRSLNNLPEVVYYSRADLVAMDMSQPSGFTVEELSTVLKSGLTGLENAFIDAEQYGVNGVMLASIAVIESGWGTINFMENNMFGYGQSAYPSKEANIATVAQGLGGNYLNPSGPFYFGTTVSHVNIKYATSTTWDDKVLTQMYSFYTDLTEYRQAAQQETISGILTQISNIEIEKNKTIGHLKALNF